MIVKEEWIKLTNNYKSKKGVRKGRSKRKGEINEYNK